MDNYCSRLAGITILGSVMAGSLLGCQPNNDTDTAVSKEAPVDNHADHEQGHEIHDNKEHEKHGHEEHSDMEHGHEEPNNHEDHSHEGHSHEEHAHAGHDHAAHTSNSTTFSCEPTATIGVSYHSDSTPQTAHLLIDGIEYDLAASAESNDQQTYMSDIGLDDRHGIIWQVSGDEAILLSKTLDDEVAISDEQILFNCHTA